MNGIKEKVWELLTDEEKTVITLKIVQGLSTLKAGEIMGKSHYKFLEILDRAKAYIRIFQTHLEEYDEIIPDYVNIGDDFREYLYYTIIQRMKVKDAYMEMTHARWIYKKTRDQIIIENMQKLYRSHKKWNKDFINLIKDFDRWNNFRILPYAVQDPSAFKRRDKNLEIKNIKHQLNLHPYTIKVILEKYEFKSDNRNVKFGYVALFKKTKKGNYKNKVFTVKLKNRQKGAVLADLGNLGFYVFKNNEDALKYIALVNSYRTSDASCTFGQKFWPTYREHTKKALNYNYIRKIIPARKYYSIDKANVDHKLTGEINI